MTKYKKHLFYSPAKGVTLIEALVSIVVFTIGLVGVSKLMGVAVRSSQNSEGQGRIAVAVDDAADRIRTLSFPTNTIARDAFLDNASCNVYTIDSEKRQCALGMLIRTEWQNQLSSNISDISSISICRKANITDNTCDNSNKTYPISLRIVWTQRLVGKGQTGQASLTNTYNATLDF